MVSSTLNPQNRKDNVKMLRRHLRLTQKEFIDQFLCDENGKALLSIATLSNLESSGGARLNELIAIVSERLHLDPMIFSKETEADDLFVRTMYKRTLWCRVSESYASEGRAKNCF